MILCDIKFSGLEVQIFKRTERMNLKITNFIVIAALIFNLNIDDIFTFAAIIDTDIPFKSLKYKPEHVVNEVLYVAMSAHHFDKNQNHKIQEKK